MKKIYVKIKGITCDHCIKKISSNLLKINGISSVTINENVASIEYNGEVDIKKIIDCINKLGYYTCEKMISDDINKLQKIVSKSEVIYISLLFILIIYGINSIFGFNIFGFIPKINSSMTYTMLFVTGLLTSIHCISMCGSINLVASSSVKRNFKKPFLYNFGRLVSYTIIGALVGLLGSALTFSITVRGVIIIFSALIMFLMALSMAGFINFKIKLFSIKTFQSSSPFIIGLLNGLMPCGPMQAMQIYALATGSALKGAIAMFVFCLGTMPLMLLLGTISNFFSNKVRIIFNKIAIILVIVLSLSMLNNGLSILGFSPSSIFKENYDNYLKSSINDNYQEVEFDLTVSGYKDIVVQKGIKVKMIINASNSSLTGCNSTVILNDFNITKNLEAGQNMLEFTPNKTGTYTYTCGMGMIKNKIIVVDDKAIFSKSK